MKKNRIITTFAILFSALSAHAGFNIEPGAYKDTYDVAKDHFSLPTVSKNIIYDTFNGAMAVSFDIPLYHQNPGLRKSLTFQYNSHLMQNNGYGLGFQLNLPKIVPNKTSLRADYVFDTGSSRNEIKKTLSGYRETQLKHFAIFETANDTTTITYPSGKLTKIDEQTGMVEKEVDGFQASFIDYQFDTQRIKKLSLYNGQEISFQYQDCQISNDYTLKKYFSKRMQNGKVVTANQCLSEINYKSGEKIKFEYDNGSLVKVYWDGYQDKPIFQAKYDTPTEIAPINKNEKVYGSVTDESVTLSLGQYGTRIINRQEVANSLPTRIDLNNTIFKATHHGDIGNLLVADFNNDGLSDILVVRYTHTPGHEDEDDFVIIDDSDFGNDGEDGDIPRQINPDVSVYLGELNGAKDNLKFDSVDSTFNLPNSFINLVPACTPQGNSYDYPEEQRCNVYSWGSGGHYETWDDGKYFFDDWYTILREHSKLLLADFNGDGLVDVFSCGRNKVYAENKYTSMQTKTHTINCTENAIAIDLNSDGFVDIIDSHNIFMNYGASFVQDNSFQSDVAHIQGFLRKQHKISRIGNYNDWKNNLNIYNDIKEKLLADTDADGMPEIISKSDFSYLTAIGKSKTLSKLKKGSGTPEAIASKSNKLMSEYKTWTGAEFKINYIYKSNAFTVKSVDIKNANKTHHDLLNYENPIIDPINNSLVGYNFLRLETNGIENQDDAVSYYEFYSDTKLQDALKRSPIHGKIRKKARCQLGACAKLDKFFNEPSGNLVPFQEADQLIKYTYSTADQSIMGQQFYEDQYYTFLNQTLKQRKSTITLPSGETDSKFKSAYEDFIPSNFHLLGPLRMVTKKQSGIYIQNQLNNNLPNRTIEEVQDFAIYQQGIKLPKSKKVSYYSGNQISDSFVSFQYHNTYGKSGFRKEIKSKVNNQLNRTIINDYDQYGRKSLEISPLGQNTNYTFSADESLKTEKIQANHPITIKSNFSSTGDLISSEKSAKGDVLTTSLDYFFPGLIKSIVYQDLLYLYSYKLEDEGVLVTEKIQSKNPTGQYSHDSTSETLYDSNKSTIYRKVQKSGKTFYQAYLELNSLGNTVKSYPPQDDDGQLIATHQFEYNYEGEVKKTSNLISGRTDEISKSNGMIEKKLNGDTQSNSTLSAQQHIESISFDNGEQNQNEFTYDGMLKGLRTSQSFLKFFRNAKGDIRQIRTNQNEVIYSRKEEKDSITYFDFINIRLNQFGGIDKISEDFGHINQYKHDHFQRLVEHHHNNELSSRVKYNQYDSITEKIVESSHSKLLIKNEYRPTQELQLQTYKFENNDYKIDYLYTSNRISSLPGFIKEIKYDRYGYFESIEYENGLFIQYDFDETGQLLAFKTPSFQESYSRNNKGQIETVESNLVDQNNIQTMNYQYNNNQQVLELPSSSSQIIRDSSYNIQSNLNDLMYFEGSNNQTLPLLYVMEEFEIRYQGHKSIWGLSEYNGEQIFFVDSDLHSIDQSFIQYLRINDRVVGAFVFDSGRMKFYPMVFDVRNSLRLVYDDLANLKLKKNYTTWGEIQTIESTDPVLQKLIKKDFAGLNRVSAKSRYLISKSRVYDPQKGQWTTLDTKLYDNPELFAFNKTLEANGQTYCAGDPVNMYDPSGQAGVGLHASGSLYTPLIRFSVGLEARIIHDPTQPWYSGWSGGVSFTHTPNPVSVSVGIGGDIGTGWLYTNASNISQLMGKSKNVVGMSGNYGPIGVGFEINESASEMDMMVLNSTGSSVSEVSGSHLPFPSFGFGFEAHSMTQFETSGWTFGETQGYQDDGWRFFNEPGGFGFNFDLSF